MKKLSGSIALSKLQHVIMNKKGKSGDMIEGIYIPFKNNYLTTAETRDGGKGVYLDINIIYNEEQDKYGQNGFVAHRAPSKIYKEASEEEKETMKNLPILGNIKDFTNSSLQDASGAASGTPLDEDDDLPF